MVSLRGEASGLAGGQLLLREVFCFGFRDLSIDGWLCLCKPLQRLESSSDS
ncbi:expressed protein [Arabidopsis lyrata subsp. lyrata]|uniref:Expressed protein n=1 Tax=Arabidopsis lyrata subsp. lyrata TaxID=81972 RepID=D7MQB9_ARALL|nr:expressed protein [Arabidopsis lyrata subsp. lyrata]EFH40340.1 expressed protein [Arabidopsis lyrata subsp. lyrata]